MKRERKRRLGTNSHNRVPSICVLLVSHCGANRASSWCGYFRSETHIVFDVHAGEEAKTCSLQSNL